MTEQPPDLPDLPLSRVEAARELLRLEKRIWRAESTLRLLMAHRERLLAVIGQTHEPA